VGVGAGSGPLTAISAAKAWLAKSVVIAAALTAILFMMSSPETRVECLSFQTIDEINHFGCCIRATLNRKTLNCRRGPH
jgi:hypothetical protein